MTWQLTSAVILGRLHILDLADPLTRLRPSQLRFSVSLVWLGLVREHMFAARAMTCKSRTNITIPVRAEGCTVMESAASHMIHHHNHAATWVCCNLIGGFLEFVRNPLFLIPSALIPQIHRFGPFSCHCAIHLHCIPKSHCHVYHAQNDQKIDV